MSNGPVFDRREQYDQIVSGLLDSEQVIAVYDAIGAGTGFRGSDKAQHVHNVVLWHITR